MMKKSQFGHLILVGSVAVVCMILPVVFKVGAQDKPRRETIQATALGQQKALGKMFNVNVNIESYSTPEDQQALISAFKAGGHDALVKILSKMKSKGRVAITGTLGYQIAYVRTFPTENGRRIRLVTNRPIQFTEAYVNGRTKDYDLSALEINLSGDPKQNDGTLIVAGKLKIDKNEQISFESYGSGPWRLANITERN